MKITLPRRVGSDRVDEALRRHYHHQLLCKTYRMMTADGIKDVCKGECMEKFEFTEEDIRNMLYLYQARNTEKVTTEDYIRWIITEYRREKSSKSEK